MKLSQPQLLVGLEGKMARVAGAWALVNQGLPPEYPLVLLQGVECAGFVNLAERLPGLRDGVRGAVLNRTLARAEYERRKSALHGWLRWGNIWMRGNRQGTVWMTLVRRVPGRGQSYQHWWDAVVEALGLWTKLEMNPPPPPAASRSTDSLEEEFSALKAAHAAVREAELDLKLARSALRLAQQEATELLMAYGHGVRARLGQRGAMVRSIPRLWPTHKPKARAGGVAAG